MSMPLLAIVLVLLIAVWWLLRQRQATKTKDAQPATRPSISKSAYHAVSIKFASNACKAAREMEGKRFLSTAAPRLPLPGCQSLECSCHFVHHTDRRGGRDRRSPFSPSGFGGRTGKYEQEKRTLKDRRTNKEDDDIF